MAPNFAAQLWAIAQQSPLLSVSVDGLRRLMVTPAPVAWRTGERSFCDKIPANVVIDGRPIFDMR